MDVATVMSQEVVCVGPATPLKEAIRLLDEHRISGMPVVADDGTVVGVLSESDILGKAAAAQPARSRVAWLLRRVARDDAVRAAEDAALVGEIMSGPALTIESDQPVAAAARLMLERGVNRLPVVDREGLVGIITRSDVARSFLQSDDELQEAIREDLLRRTMWVDPDSVEVRVVQGVARIRGTVDRRSTAELIDRLVRRLHGILAADVDLRYMLDDARTRPPERDLVHADFPR